jgi:hypothetical protein
MPLPQKPWARRSIVPLVPGRLRGGLPDVEI